MKTRMIFNAVLSTANKQRAMKKRLISLALLVIILALTACGGKENQADTKHTERFETEEELNTQDFKLVYELGELFLKDYYAFKAGESVIDFTLYIVNENLLKFSNKRVEDESYTMDIKQASVGLSQARFMPEEKCFYIRYTTVVRDNNIGGFSEVVEVLISAADGRLVISDWYIAHGAGSSSFDEVHRNNAAIDSPDIWDDQEFVKSIFENAGIK